MTEQIEGGEPRTGLTDHGRVILWKVRQARATLTDEIAAPQRYDLGTPARSEGLGPPTF